MPCPYHPAESDVKSTEARTLMNDRGDTDMSDDNILMLSVLDRNEITIKQLSTWTGYAQDTLYKYRQGHLTIPSIVWRVLYKHTGDPRIMELITGDLAVIVTVLPEGKADTAATLKTLIEARSRQLDWERDILGILADGRIDTLDRRQVAQIRERFPLMLSTLVQLQQTITRQYDLSTQTRKEPSWSSKPTRPTRRKRTTRKA